MKPTAPHLAMLRALARAMRAHATPNKIAMIKISGAPMSTSRSLRRVGTDRPGDGSAFAAAGGNRLLVAIERDERAIGKERGILGFHSLGSGGLRSSEIVGPCP
jgi:hypothetical protein